MFVRGILPPILWAKESHFPFIHADDLTQAMVLAVDKAPPGANYILVDASATTAEVMQIWQETPGGMRSIGWMPPQLARFVATMGEPMLRGLGFPAFNSTEVVNYSLTNWNYVGDKAKQALGITFRGLRALWHDTLEAERAIAQKRRWTISPEI